MLEGFVRETNWKTFQQTMISLFLRLALSVVKIRRSDTSMHLRIWDNVYVYMSPFQQRHWQSHTQADL